MRANLHKAILRKAELFNADLADADLYGADLSDADLAGARCMRTNFMFANLTEVFVRKAVFYDADLRGATLKDMGDIHRAGWDRANIHLADISTSDREHLMSNGAYA